ncbi:protein NEN1 [Pelomyxa schiedti]|nr:protein NEN1 [Pelomyxa schiedti]
MDRGDGGGSWSFADTKAEEIAFYDLETTIPSSTYKERDVLEFGAVVVNKKTLREVDSFSTLVFSPNVTARSVECNKITKEMLQGQPSFADVADRIYTILHGRIWAGHNIEKFDNPIIFDEFKKLKREPPQPIGVIDTLPLLRKIFSTHVDNMKMNTLGKYFDLGDEEHRGEADARMTLQVLKNCCTTVVLEQHFSTTPSGTSPSENPPKSNPQVSSSVAASSSVTSCTQNTSETSTATYIENGINSRKAFWICYTGGSTPGAWRQIAPTKWVQKDKTFYAHSRGAHLMFRVDKITGVRLDGPPPEPAKEEKPKCDVVETAPILPESTGTETTTPSQHEPQEVPPAAEVPNTTPATTNTACSSAESSSTTTHPSDSETHPCSHGTLAPLWLTNHSAILIGCAVETLFLLGVWWRAH